MSIAFYTCPLCEATCGLELHIEDQEVRLVRGDRDDVFSHGYLCPKGTAIRALEADPDRLRGPQIREGDTWRDATWDEAFELIDANLTRIVAEHGPDAVAVYLGNPSAHNLSGLLYNRVLLQAARTQNVYSASTVDQMPKQVSAGLMFGAALSIPVPDVDRTDYLLMLGANPFASNGSLMTAPDIPGRLRALRARGGRLVVIDPRRSKTAEEADEHCFIRPATDAHFLAALVQVLFADDLIDLGSVAAWVAGVDEVRAAIQPFTPEIVAPICGIDAATIRRIAHELANAKSAAVYGRIGTCTQEYGTLASWLVDVLNVITGNLDRPGGAMFAKPATASATNTNAPGRGRGVRFGRRRSRVRGLSGVLRGAADGVLRRGDRDARRWSGPRGGDDRRQPRRLQPRLGTARPCVRVARLHGQRRHLPQRDDPPRRRDPSARADARARSLRRRAVVARHPQRRQLLAAGLRAAAGRDARVADHVAAGGDRRRARVRTPTSTRSTIWSSATSSARR